MPSHIVKSIPVTQKQVTDVDVLITRDGSCSIGCFHRFEVGAQPGDVAAHNEDIISIMNDFRKHSISRLNVTRGFYEKHMKYLRDIGITALQSLGSHFIDNWAKYGDSERNITAIVQAYPILWEFFYSGPPHGAVDYYHFWGCHHRVTRRLLGVQGYPSRLDLPTHLLFCRNHRLAHWEKERDALSELAEGGSDFSLVNLEDCFIDKSPEDIVSDWDDLFFAACQSEDFGFIHIASHLNADENKMFFRSFLEISYHERLVKILLRRLSAVDSDKEYFKFRQKPLVFLNACKTMSTPEDLLRTQGFPDSFIKLGAGAVIATACDIPDVFAMAFAKEFYRFFLDSPFMTASNALRLARLFFLEKYNNPLGLAYGLYAHGDLMVQKRPPMDSYDHRQFGS